MMLAVNGEMRIGARLFVRIDDLDSGKVGLDFLEGFYALVPAVRPRDEEAHAKAERICEAVNALPAKAE